MKVLIADDDPTTRDLLRIYTRGESYDLVFAEDGGQAIEMFKSQQPDLLVTDVRMPVASGEEVMLAALETAPQVPVLIMTAHGSVEDAVRLLRMGAADYITKPVTKEFFNHRLHRALETVRLAEEVSRLRQESAQTGGGTIIGNSPAITQILSKLPLSAQTDTAVIIFGESGTGKELIAQRLHLLSKRSDKPFITVNCGALPDTLLESELFGYVRGAFTDARRDNSGLVDEANHGTLFLDEIGDLSLPVQVKLLRFLQNKEYKPLGSPQVRQADIRIVAATHRDLKAMVQQNRFREDLYYRLNIVPIQMPPLRERRSDIPLLATHFLRRYRVEFDKAVDSFSPSAMQKLVTYPWPGNVRELENKVQQALVLAQRQIIDVGDLLFEDEQPEDSTVKGPLTTFKEEKRRTVDTFEVRYVTQLLELFEGNISRASQYAGIDRKNLWTLMRKHGLRADKFRARRGTLDSPT